MKINVEQRKTINGLFQKAFEHNMLNEEEQKLMQIFAEPYSKNVRFDHDKMRFTTDKSFAPLEKKHLMMLIQKGMLYFDFSDNAEEDKQFYEEHGDTWDESYSYNKVDSMDDDWDAYYAQEEGDAFFHLNDDEGCVDPCRFDIRELIYVDETRINLIDRGCYDGDIRKLIIR